MISRPMALASAISVPTSIPSQTSAHWAADVRLGSTTKSLAPLRTPLNIKGLELKEFKNQLNYLNNRYNIISAELMTAYIIGDEKKSDARPEHWTPRELWHLSLRFLDKS